MEMQAGTGVRQLTSVVTVHRPREGEAEELSQLLQGITTCVHCFDFVLVRGQCLVSR